LTDSENEEQAKLMKLVYPRCNPNCHEG